jgi:hypothetical protein
LDEALAVSGARHLAWMDKALSVSGATHLVYDVTYFGIGDNIDDR